MNTLSQVAWNHLVMTLAHLLGIHVYYYLPSLGNLPTGSSLHGNKWHMLNPCSIDNMITENNLNGMGIYLNHPSQHFEVVTSI